MLNYLYLCSHAKSLYGITFNNNNKRKVIEIDVWKLYFKNIFIKKNNYDIFKTLIK